MHRIALAALFVFAGWLVVAPSPVSAKPDAADDVLAAEHARADAITHQDLTTLEKFLGDDLVYCHATARVDSKSSFLQALHGQMRYIKVESQDAKVRVFGNTAVINGNYTVQTAAPDGTPHAPDQSFVTMIYAKRDGHWVLINYQATRHAPAPAVAPAAQ